MRKQRTRPRPSSKRRHPIASLKLASNELPIRTLIQVLCAGHLASRVGGVGRRFKDQGGLVLVGPPGVLKSTFLNVVENVYHDALEVTNINMPTLNDMKDQIAAGNIRTLVIPEMRMLYERDPRTASHVEGSLRALAGEGFKMPSFEPQGVNTKEARCFVMAAVQPRFQIKHFNHWEESGFARRFLWPLIFMKDPHLLDRAVENGEPIDLKLKDGIPPMPKGDIPDLTTVEERRELRTFLKRQPGAGVHNLQLLVLVRMLAVLKWWSREQGWSRGEAMRTLRLFARTFQPGGAELVLI